MLLLKSHSWDRSVITGVERTFSEGEIIVSKTDTKGIITYANDVFLEVAGFRESEVLGKPHNILRHPAMPKLVFKLLWDRVKSGHEIFAYVINRCKNGDHYWVLAHVTPSYNSKGELIGYHSNRRSPKRSAIAAIEPLYAALLAEEKKHASTMEAMEASGALFTRVLAEKKVTYDALVHALSA